MADARRDAQGGRGVPAAQPDRHRRARRRHRALPAAGAVRDTVVLLDEAYVEFRRPSTGSTRPRSSTRYPNVVVLRTFSKAYGLAGLRIGYGFCAPDLARQLWTMQLPFGNRHHQPGGGGGLRTTRKANCSNAFG